MVPIALKSSQPFWRSLIRPMSLISLGLHGLLLLTPTSSNPKPEPPAEEKVKLTQLPAENQPVVPPARPSITPRVVVKPAARPITPPLPRRVDAPPPLRSAPIPRSAPSTPQQSTPAQQPAPTPSAAAATTPAPAVSPTAPPADPFTAGFPIYPGSQQGSFGLPSQFESGSRKTNDGMDQVDNFYQTALAAGYAPTAVEQPGRIVYQLTKGEQTRYQHCFE
jgi:outer membrane biosynthesis protein TonB